MKSRPKGGFSNQISLRINPAIPVRLQYLHHRLLDEAVRPLPSESPRAAPAAACSCPQAWARIAGWLSCRSPTLMPSMPAAPLLGFTCANACFRFSRSIAAFIDGPAAAGRSRQAFAARASVAWGAALRAPPSLRYPSSVRSDASAAWLGQDRRSTDHFRPFGPSAAPRRLLCSWLTSVLRSGRLVAAPPEVRSTAFAARPPNLPPSL
jgi:hypothetical protein